MTKNARTLLLLLLPPLVSILLYDISFPLLLLAFLKRFSFRRKNGFQLQLLHVLLVSVEIQRDAKSEILDFISLSLYCSTAAAAPVSTAVSSALNAFMILLPYLRCVMCVCLIFYTFYVQECAQCFCCTCCSATFTTANKSNNVFSYVLFPCSQLL